MDSCAVNLDYVRGRRADLFRPYERARSRNLATSYLVRVRHTVILLNRKKIFGNDDSKFNFVLRRVADTRLAIGARKFSISL